MEAPLIDDLIRIEVLLGQMKELLESKEYSDSFKCDYVFKVMKPEIERYGAILVSEPYERGRILYPTFVVTGERLIRGYIETLEAYLHGDGHG